jgi:hypothetical protein
VERHQSLNVSTVMNGLMAMTGGMILVNLGIRFLNIKRIFYAELNALWRHMKSIKISTLGLSE